MRGTLNIIAASGGAIKATAGDSGDVGQTASVLPIPVPLGNAAVTVAGGASPTNAVITLTQAVPGVGNSATLYDDEFTSAPWLTHRTYQTGDKWGFINSALDPNGNGIASDDGITWWANPVATPQATTVYQAPAQGTMSLGLMNTPTGIGISQAFIGTLINNQHAPGALHLFGYHEMRVRVTNTRGFAFHWDIEDFPNSSTLTVQISLDIWTDASGIEHVQFSIPGGLPTNPATTVIYQTSSLDITQAHIYGLNWQADHITAYVDGNAVGQVGTPGGDFQSQPCFAYFATAAATLVGDGSPTAASLPTFAQLDYYRLFSSLPTTAGVVLVHAYNAGGSANTITDSVGQTWVRHPDARLGSPPVLTAITFNTLPMTAGSTITVGFTNPGTNTQGQAAAWYVPYVNGSSFGSLASVGATGATPNAPTITLGTPDTSSVAVFVTLPTTGPALNAGVVQVQYRVTGSTGALSSAPSPPSYITPTVGSLLDGFGNTWSLASNGNPVINTTVIDAVSHSQEMFLVTGTLWQFDGTSWYNFTPVGLITSSSQLAWNGPIATSPLLSPGILVSGLSSGTSYDFSAYVTNTAGTGLSSAVSQTATSVGSSVGPPVTSAFVTADFTSAMQWPISGGGQATVERRLWGVSSSTLMNGNFVAWADPAVQSALGTINPTLYGLFQGDILWDNNLQVIPSAMANLVNNFYKCDPLGISGVIMSGNFDLNGLRPGGATVSDYGTAMANLASYLLNYTMPNGKKFPLIGMTGHNEPDINNESAAISYFKDMATKVKAVSNDLLIIGPTTANAAWFDFPTQVPQLDIFSYDCFTGFTNGSRDDPFNTDNITNPLIVTRFADDANFCSNNLSRKPIGMALGGWGPAVGGGDNSVAMDNSYLGAVFMGNRMIQAINNSNVPFWAMKWGAVDNGEYGVTTWSNQTGYTTWPNSNPSGYWGFDGVTTKVTPKGYMMAQCVRRVYGSRWNVPTNNTGMQVIAATPSAGSFGLMLVNNPGNGTKSGAIALSHWPVNSSGTANVNVWQMTSAQTLPGMDGASSTVTVNGGLTPTMTFPDSSVTIIYAGATGNPSPPPANTTPLFDDQANSLSLFNPSNPGAGGLWEPCFPDSRLNGFAINGTWALNPFNPATPINDVYTASGGNLVLTLENTPPSLAAACGNQPFVGGHLQTYPTFMRNQGYWEARVAVPAVPGTEFDFWLFGSSGQAEIDIIQITTVANGFQSGAFALHDASTSAVIGSFYTYNAPNQIDCSQFHQYGMEWTASTITLYIDRVAQVSFPTPPGYTTPLATIIDFLSGNGTFTGDASPASMPASAQIDYVTVWAQRPF